MAVSTRRPSWGPARGLALAAAALRLLAAAGEDADADSAAGNVNATTLIPSIADMTGVKGNSSEDLSGFVAALVLNGATIVAVLIVFSILRRYAPLVYSNNVEKDLVPFKPAATLWSWLPASLALTPEQVMASAGLDAAMMLQLCNLCVRVALWLSLPLVLVLCPMHAAVGGGAAGEDALSRVDMGNVNKEHKWFYYIHAVVVWGVCITVHKGLCNAQDKFLPLRFAWLAALPEARAHTVLVEEIPPAYRSDEGLRDFFSRALGHGSVREAHIVRRASVLRAAVAERAGLRRRLREARLLERRDGVRPLGRMTRCGRKVDVIAHCEPRIEELTSEIAAERARIRSQSDAHDAAVNAGSGFVTFAGRREAEMARSALYSSDRQKWRMSEAPDVESIRWQDLTVRTELRRGAKFLGYVLVISSIIFFMPISALISTLGMLIKAGPVWTALAPTIGLQLMLSILPMLLLMIFGMLFALKSEMWAQHYLQVWFFIFQLIFVVLVTALSGSVVESFQLLAKEPLKFPSILAEALPKATHFYMNYIVIQTTGHAIAILRASQFVKYRLFRALYRPEEARALAEPEDQSYQGMGSRHARLAIIMVVCIVFSTLSPLVAPLTALHFALCRVVYGYLLVFTESHKPDTGGAFWVTALKQIQGGLLIYVVLMLGVLSARSPNVIAPALALPTLPFVFWSMRCLRESYDWQRLPFEEIAKADQTSHHDKLPESESYVQPELTDAKDAEPGEDLDDKGAAPGEELLGSGDEELGSGSERRKVALGAGAATDDASPLRAPHHQV